MVCGLLLFVSRICTLQRGTKGQYIHNLRKTLYSVYNSEKLQDDRAREGNKREELVWAGNCRGHALKQTTFRDRRGGLRVFVSNYLSSVCFCISSNKHSFFSVHFGLGRITL